MFKRLSVAAVARLSDLTDHLWSEDHQLAAPALENHWMVEVILILQLVGVWVKGNPAHHAFKLVLGTASRDFLSSTLSNESSSEVSRIH